MNSGTYEIKITSEMEELQENGEVMIFAPGGIVFAEIHKVKPTEPVHCGDLISRDGLLQDIERAVFHGKCHGLMDVLEIIRATPAAKEAPAEDCGSCQDKAPYCPTDCPTQFVTRAMANRSR